MPQSPRSSLPGSPRSTPPSQRFPPQHPAPDSVRRFPLHNRRNPRRPPRWIRRLGSHRHPAPPRPLHPKACVQQTRPRHRSSRCEHRRLGDRRAVRCPMFRMRARGTELCPPTRGDNRGPLLQRPPRSDVHGSIAGRRSSRAFRPPPRARLRPGIRVCGFYCHRRRAQCSRHA